MFPVTNSSQTIIDCFLNETEKHHVEVLYRHSVKNIDDKGGLFQIETSQGPFLTKKIVIATGSSAKIWSLLEDFGHTISAAVPSLFTFKISDERIKDIPGVVAENVGIKILETNLYSEGPLLITHWGMSAPAILKLSAFGALEIAKRNYDFKIEINFIKQSLEDCIEVLKTLKQDLSKKTVFKSSQFNLPKRLWYKLVLASKITEVTRWADVNKLQLETLSNQLTQAVFHVQGKSAFKEEFVTAGGVSLKDINFKTFESKCMPGVYFAGEVLDIDAITGGFNFQNAWTGGYIVSKNISKDLI
jgi:predicted Rossmann fold flavoprotein